MLTNSDLIELTEFRRALHRHPEVSGEEVETAKTIETALMPGKSHVCGHDGHMKMLLALDALGQCGAR